MIDAAIFSLLKLNSLVALEIGVHIYPGVVPEKITGPAIRYIVSDNPSEFDGGGVEHKKTASVQIDVFHGNYTVVRAMGQALQKQFHGHKGQHDSETIFLIDVLDSNITHDSSTREHRITLTMTVTYRDNQP
ncbi:MAG: hypothetical protein RPR40_10260 [Bermanella sp.]